MKEGQNKRLKNAREKQHITLAQASERSVFKLTQQSIIKYEKGNVIPKIDVLDDLCRIYDCTVDYIIYGTDETNLVVPESDVLTSLWSLMFTKKLVFDGKVLQVNDDKLLNNLEMLQYFNNHVSDMSSAKQIEALLRGIKKMSRDNKYND